MKGSRLAKTIKIIPAFEKPRQTKALEELTAQTLAITSKNDKPLTELEIDYERKAEKLNIVDFPRIHPRRATIAFMVRGMDGGNYQAIEFLRSSLHPHASSVGVNSKIFRIIAEFDHLDESSQLRVDCLDHLCRKNRVTVLAFIETMTSGIIQYHNLMTSAVVAAEKPELAAKIFAFAKDKKQSSDRRLAAEVAGLTSREPLVNVETGNKKTIVNNNVVLSFADFSRENDKLIRKPKEIEDGNTVDGEIIEGG